MKPLRVGGLIMYLLHFDRPLSNRQHYLGSTLEARKGARWLSHAKGQGGAFTRRFAKAGIGFQVAAVWPISCRLVEHDRKKHGHLDRLCPICRGELGLEGRPRYQAQDAGLKGKVTVDFPDDNDPPWSD